MPTLADSVQLPWPERVIGGGWSPSESSRNAGGNNTQPLRYAGTRREQQGFVRIYMNEILQAACQQGKTPLRFEGVKAWWCTPGARQADEEARQKAATLLASVSTHELAKYVPPHVIHAIGRRRFGKFKSRISYTCEESTERPVRFRKRPPPMSAATTATAQCAAQRAEGDAAAVSTPPSLDPMRSAGIGGQSFIAPAPAEPYCVAVQTAIEFKKVCESELEEGEIEDASDAKAFFLPNTLAGTRIQRALLSRYVGPAYAAYRGHELRAESNWRGRPCRASAPASGYAHSARALLSRYAGPAFATCGGHTLRAESHWKGRPSRASAQTSGYAQSERARVFATQDPQPQQAAGSCSAQSPMGQAGYRAAALCM